MMYFLQINRVDFQIVDSSYIRYDDIVGTLGQGRLAFSPPFSGHFSDYFYYIRNVNSFTNTGAGSANNEVLVNRKSFFFSQDNEFDCQASKFISYADEMYSASIVYTDNALSGTPECVFTQTELDDSATLAFPGVGDDFCLVKIALDYGVSTQFVIFDASTLYEDNSKVLLPSPYINQVQMIPTDLVKVYPQQELLDSSYGFGTEDCAAGTGIQRPTTIDMENFQQKIGTTGTRVIDQTYFMQCQAQAVTYTFLYEDGTRVQTAQNVFASFSDSDETFTFDLETFSPAPGVRLF